MKKQRSGTNECPWVVLDYSVQPPVLRCTRCGETHTVTLPMPLDTFVVQGEGFCAVHRDCKGEVTG